MGALLTPLDGLERRTKFQLLVGFLVVCAASLRSIPLLQPWGADLHNLQIYQKCAGDESPYPIDGQVCGDLWVRPMIYPPFLYHSFRWLRWVTLPTAMHIWTTFVFVAFAGMMYAWTRCIAPPKHEGAEKSGAELAIFCALLFLQYPLVFTLERGGTDTGALLFFTLGAYAFTRFGPVWAGCAVGLAAAYKLYPAIAVGVLVVALLLTEWRPSVAALRSGAWRRVGGAAWLRFGGGAAIGFLLPSAVYPSEARIYFTTVLPKFARHTEPTIGHSLSSLVGDVYPNFALLPIGALLAIWCWAARRAFARGDAGFAFAGALAVSTYAQKTSWDYNLVTTYPLFLLLFLRAYRENRFSLLVFGLFAMVCHGSIFVEQGPVFRAEVNVAFQVAFLAMAALAVAREEEGGATVPATASGVAAPVDGARDS